MNKSSVLSQIIEACLSVVILYINVLLFGCPYVPYSVIQYFDLASFVRYYISLFCRNFQ
jgi:hypothetical protein